ncbi:Alcohol acetyltransferase [Pyrenophora seminiperda CCB06]|uniref:Alcohol acetyltransferase n=1 Tax=Pyrenophora seminiperda CCB06 TaxID=1302712 RepID=A0A3M7ME65_9PLEO|nr:Alcohol acetyltransferase [Pyrenophora seminiperda CCB06]
MCACVTATYSSPIATRSLESLVYAALRILINDHPILSAIPVNEHTNKPYFARLPQIDLRTCTQFLERNKPFSPTKAGEVDVELGELLESQHKLDWNEDIGTRPFWRVTVLHSPGVEDEFTLSWFFHHGISDGTSALLFHQGLLAAFNSFDFRKESEPLEDGLIVVTSKALDLFPPLERMHKLPISLSFLLKELWDDTFNHRHPKLWTGGKINNDPQAKNMRFRSIVLSEDKTNKLVGLSRQNKTTLTATMETIIAAATLANLDSSKYDRIVSDGAMSLRRFLSLPETSIEEQIGVYVSMYLNTHVHPSSVASEKERRLAEDMTALDIFSWEKAREVCSTITKEVEKNGKNSRSALLGWTGNQRKYWLDRVGKNRTESIELTNIGAWKQRPGIVDGNWELGRMTFSQCSAVAGSAYSAAIVTGGDGCMSIGFSWLDGVVDMLLMQRLIDSVQECIDELAAGKKKF